VNFFLVAVAFLAAAFVTALKDKHYAVAVGVGILGTWLSWWFHRLDLRTKELVEAARPSCGTRNDVSLHRPGLRNSRSSSAWRDPAGAGPPTAT
jgi:hypothetical protein